MASHFQGPAISRGQPFLSFPWASQAHPGGHHTMGAHMKKTIKQFMIQRSCFQQQFLESPSPNCKSMLFFCQKEISMQRNECQDTSPGLPAEFTLLPLALSVCSPRPSSFIPASCWSFLGYNSKILTSSQGTFKMNSFTAPETLGDSTFLEGPGGLAAHPQALCVGLASLTQSQGQNSASQDQIPRLSNFMDH